MPGSDDLQDFVEEKLLSYDPDIDLSEGAPAQIEVVEPIVSRFQPDPFEMDIPTFIKERLQQEYPDLDTDDGDALVDFMVKPMEALLDPLIREVTFLRQNKSLANPELLAPAEADALMGNLFVRRTRGTFSSGQVRVSFNAPIAVSVSVGNMAATDDGLNYIPSTPQEISAEAMLFNQDGNLFYFDVAMQAEQEGDEYNVEAGEITSISNIPAAVKVSNLSRFRDGLPEETTLEFVERGENSLTERSLVVPRGVIARLFSQYSDLQHLQLVGFRDPEMLRDILTGGGLGPIVMYGTDGATSDDGDGDGLSSLFESATGGFFANIGAVGAVENFTLTVEDVDYSVIGVVADDLIQVAGLPDPSLPAGSPLPPSTLPDNLSGVPFYIRQNIMTISGLPGGVVNVNGPNGLTIFESDEVHIGGTTDFYVRGTENDEETLVLEAVSDELPVHEAVDMETRLTGFPADVVYAGGVLPKNFVALGVRTGMTLVLETGGDAGSYQVLKVHPGGAVGQLQVDPPPTNPATNLSYKIVDEIDINLNEPKTIRESGEDLKTILGSVQVSTVSEVDFDAVGGEEGDILRVEGDTLNKGDFQVKEITGTGNKLLSLGTEMRRTSSSESWSLFKLGEGIQTPVVRISSIEILDSSQQPTGDTVPYADPIDIQSSAFSNVGVGEKETISDGVMGILGTVDLNVDPTSVNGKVLRISVNNALEALVVFFGVVTAQDIVDQINSSVPGYNVAALYNVDTEVRLSIRSRNNWLRVRFFGALSANADLGFSTTFNEDNRQINSASIPDWTTLGLQEERDSVYVLTGLNIEFWYLHAVEGGRLLVSRVDESGRAVFPLTDHRTTVRVGSRSFGKVRCYFLEPTSFEVRGSYHRALIAGHAPNIVYGDLVTDEEARTEFTWDMFEDATAFMRFFPDPALSHQIMPVTGESVPNNLLIDTTVSPTIAESVKDPTIGPGQYSRQAIYDFLLREVHPGDILEIDYHPLQGVADLRDAPTGDIDYVYTLPIVGGDLLGKTLIFSLENGPERTVTFTAEVDSPSRVVAEINQQLGEVIAYEEDTGGAIHLRLEADFSFILKATGTATTILGLDPVVGNNDAPAKGEYVVLDAGVITGAVSNHSRLTIDGGFTPGQNGPSQHFTIRRPGVQRVSATDMNENQEGGLYYADIELMSFGPGDEFNIDAALQLEVEDHHSDGYLLSTADENLSFSEEEQLYLRVGRRLLTVGTTDSPGNMTQISQQNLQVNYDRSDLVAQIQSFAESDLERVLNADILVRHLTPHYVHTEIFYEGGSTVSVVLSDIEDLIDAVLPDELLEVSAVADIPRRRGATRVEMPITLIGVVHKTDRTIRAVRSQDGISIGRLATFIPDVLDITRET